MENLGGVKGKKSKNNMLQKTGSRTLVKLPLNPVEIQYSCGLSAYHLSKNRAYVLNLATVHFRFLAHSLANARSLGLRRADSAFTPVGRFLTLLWGLVLATRSVRQSTAVSCSHQPAVLPLPSGTGVTRLATALPPAF